MAELIFEHSDEWMEKLTTPLTELPPAERTAVVAHLQTCPDCSRYVAGFNRLGSIFQALPAPDFPAGPSPRLQQLWQKEVQQEESEPRTYGHPATFEEIIRELME